MIAQPVPSAPASGIEQDILFLRQTPDEALSRIGNLERQIPLSEPATQALFPMDSPALKVAKELCIKFFPGPLEVEVLSAPDDPSAKWYAITVVAKGTAKEVVDNQLRWANELDHQFPEEAVDIRLSVKPA